METRSKIELFIFNLYCENCEDCTLQLISISLKNYKYECPECKKQYKDKKFYPFISNENKSFLVTTIYE